MRYHTATTLLLLLVLPAQTVESALEDQWLRDGLSNEDRNELVERAKKQTFEKIAPAVLKLLVEYRPNIMFTALSDTPWNNERRTAKDRIYLMAGAVWQHHMTPRNDPSKAKVVLSLLRMASRPAEKSILIVAIWHRQWCPDAELALLGLCRANGEPLDIRALAAAALLDHCDLNTYMPTAIEVILAHENGLPRCKAFNSTTNQGNRLFELNDKNRLAILAVGFNIIRNLAAEELRYGYFVARQLGFILKKRHQFAPSPRANEYRGKNGLKDEFFIDTVKNAIAWHSDNQSELESN